MNLELCVKTKKGKEFQTGEVRCGVIWQVTQPVDQFNVHAWLPAGKIKNLNKKKEFSHRAGEFISFNNFLDRMQIRISPLHMRKLKKVTKAKNIWVNWKKYSEELKKV